MEDDVDWDVRIKSQLRDFALSSRVLTQPLARSKQYADITFPNSNKAPQHKTKPVEFSFDHLPSTEPPRLSPYGDNWEFLWLGHCGAHFPFADNAIPKGRVIHRNDPTVAEKRYLWTINSPFTLVEDYPEHTRAVHHSQEGVCSLAYAVSQRGARRLLQEVGLRDVSDGFDILLRFFCEGTQGRTMANCLTVQPSLFHHHRPVGPVGFESDIGQHGDGFRDKAYTDMVRWSVRLNAERILAGETEMHDQYPNAD